MRGLVFLLVASVSAIVLKTKKSKSSGAPPNCWEFLDRAREACITEWDERNCKWHLCVASDQVGMGKGCSTEGGENGYTDDWTVQWKELQTDSKLTCPPEWPRHAGHDLGNSDPKYLKDHMLEKPLGDGC